MRNAIATRGIYYRLQPGDDAALAARAVQYGASVGQYEPPIMENLVARAYILMGGENLWVSRLFTAFFWLAGGLALFDLARRMVSFRAALAALAYYLVLPFGVQASRSFQPDPGMVMGILLAVYCLYRWSDEASRVSAVQAADASRGWLAADRRTYTWALLAGAAGGLAILTKIVAFYIVGAAAIAAVLLAIRSDQPLRDKVRRVATNPQVWLMALMMVLPSVIYYSGRQGRAAEYLDSWTISLSHLLIEPTFYVRWFNLVQDLVGMTLLLGSLVGVLLANGRARWFLLSLWLGYAAYGLTLPYQMYTHTYYHLQLVPIIALSLASLAERIFDAISAQPRGWQVLFAGILLAGVAFPALESINTLRDEDFRGEPAYWQSVAAQLPTDGKIIALTQDYGFKLQFYGWRKVDLWPIRGELALAQMRGKGKDFEADFTRRIENRDYFVVTAFGQFNNQPELKQILNEKYPLLAQGDGYLIYDLANPLP